MSIELRCGVGDAKVYAFKRKSIGVGRVTYGPNIVTPMFSRELLDAHRYYERGLFGNSFTYAKRRRMMLKEDKNRLLTQVGPNTPLGKMMRRYWHPIALSSQVSESDGPPLRAKLLSERFVVFRDTNGAVGVLDEMCMHRGVSLALGRNEEGGLRCLYHGWKYAVDGAILETPNNPDCRFRQRVTAPAYPVREQSGLIWTYIGPKEIIPPFRLFGWDMLPESRRHAFRMNNKASWISQWEAGLDSSHVGILHTNYVRPSWKDGLDSESTPERAAYRNAVPAFDSGDPPTIELEDTHFGFQYCALRSLDRQELGSRNARLVPAIMPYMRIIPTVGGLSYFLEVPLDDFETATFMIACSADGPVDPDFRRKAMGLDSPFYDPVTCDVTLDWENHMGQDRSRMDRDWTGIQGLLMEDFAMVASIGRDWNRRRERLVSSDAAVARLRRCVLHAMKRFAQGEPPPAVNQADMTGVTACDRNIRSSDAWQGLAPANQTPPPET